jgi:LysM repeat protein
VRSWSETIRLRLAAGIVLAAGALFGAPEPAQAITHEVAEGHSLWKIAKRYNVSVDAIREANGLTKGDPIQPGQVLQIPDGKGSLAPSKGSSSKAAGSGGGAKKGDKVHTVASGQSLGRIAKRYNVTVDELCEANGIKRSDPIKPGQELVIPGVPGSSTKKADKKDDPKQEAATKPVHWVLKKPDASTQTQKNPDDRGGVNPCLTKDPGFGVYDNWDRSGLSMGGALIPQRGGVTKSGRFDVVFHFHGHDPTRKEWVKVMNGTVFVGVTLGIGSGVYTSTFSNPQVFERMISDLEKMVAKKTGKKSAKVRKIGLSAWSAGYGAIEQILTQKAGKNVDVVILLDGLHSGYGTKTLDESQLKPFVDFARSAKAERNVMFVSHSSIIPPGYASTTETASYLIDKVGGKPRTTKPRRGDPMGLELIRRYDAGGFHVRGFRGNDKMDHCAHIGLIGDVLKVHVKPRWNSPRGYKKK